MSEYLYVAFQAVDAPLNDKQLEFAQRQSSRAEVTRWSLSVEYDYASFRGDVDGLLRNGYDVFLQHANYGIREIKLRLPHGLPFPQSVWSRYVDSDRLSFEADVSGRGGILSVCPCHEPGDLEEIWETQEHLDAAIRVRERLISGDLRALYLLWLCAAEDAYNHRAESIEPPVPHGIAEAASFGSELLSFFGVDPLVLVAAGAGVPAAPDAGSKDEPVARWLASLDSQRAKQLLHQMLTGDTAREKANLLAEIRDSQTTEAWPTSDMQRSFDDLLQVTEGLRDQEAKKQAQVAQEKARREAEKAALERAERITDMRNDPDKWLRKVDQLVDVRGTDNYKAAAEFLGELREAIGGNEGDRIARQHAANLTRKHPTLTRLKSSLRKCGLL